MEVYQLLIEGLEARKNYFKPLKQNPIYTLSHSNHPDMIIQQKESSRSTSCG